MTDQAAGAPELQAFHDTWFAEAESSGTDIYGSPDDWSPVKRSGHFRRMEILAELIPTDLRGKTAVDFGSGPWGFGCIAPQLRSASECVCIDVSQHALEISKRNEREISEKVSYAVSDGEVIPLPDSSVDVFWGGEVIEHVRFPEKFMEEIARVCREGAQVVLSTPNKDALFYRAKSEINTIGPEHIALMNHAELIAVVEKFCKNICIYGYEFSLLEDLDGLPYTASQLDSLQRRSYQFPETASGMVFSGTVEKARYDRNARGWRLEEFLWSQLPGHESLCTPAVLFDRVDGGSLKSDAELSFALRGTRGALLFWAHDWSGIVDVVVNGKSQAIDLYSRLAGFYRVELESSGDKFNVIIRRTGGKRDVSADSQVIFFKAISYEAAR